MSLTEIAGAIQAAQNSLTVAQNGLVAEQTDENARNTQVVALQAQVKALQAKLAAAQPPPPTPQPASHFQLVIDEQFAYSDGPAQSRLPNSMWWSPYDGVPGTEGVGMRKGSLATVRSGNLVIAGERPNAMDEDWNHFFSTGCAMGPVAETYGRWEVRAKMSAGAGFWGNFMLWPTNDNWPVEDEIDVFESPAAARLSATTTIHHGADNQQSSQITYSDFTQFHVWVVEWTPDTLLIQCDGRDVWRVTDKAMIPTTNHHLVAQTDMGEWAGKPGPSDPTRVELEIDYVRQWEYAA